VRRGKGWGEELMSSPEGHSRPLILISLISCHPLMMRGLCMGHQVKCLHC
jgi:hypothetical protein